MRRLSLLCRLVLVAALTACGARSSSPDHAAASGPLARLDASRLASLRAHERQRAEAARARTMARRAALGAGVETALELRAAHTDAFGQTHVRLGQTYRGVKVFGAEAIAHVGPEGEDLGETAQLYAPALGTVTPRLTAAAAVAAAERAFAPRAAYAYPPQSELVVWPERERALRPAARALHRAHPNALDYVWRVRAWHLAWQVRLQVEAGGDTRHRDYLVDARSGEILRSWSSLQTATAAAGVGHSEYSGDVTVDTAQEGATYQLCDLTRGAGGAPICTYDMANAGGNGHGTLYTDADDTWGDGQQYVAGGATDAANGQTAAVDAAWGLARSWDYYRAIHQHDGIDGTGTAPYSRVHYREDPAVGYDNAFWSDSCFCMTYGDGSGPPNGFPSLTDLQTVGHELTHGVTASTAALIYAGESGGLNEATSDIFGVMVEFWTRDGAGATIGDGSHVPADGRWVIGWQVPPIIRWMYRPSLDGASPDAWYPGIDQIDVHYSSGPMNRAFYFLSVGAPAPGAAGADPDRVTDLLPAGMAGIGNDAAAAIWYRALTTYLVPISDYRGARSGALHAAADLYGRASPEYAAVQNAFAGIGVGDVAGSADDLLPPTVSVQVQGTSGVVQLVADAADEGGVEEVVFLANNVVVGTAYAQPYQVPLDLQTLPNGTQVQITAAAFDVSQNMAAAHTTLTVANAAAQLLTDVGFEGGGNGWDLTGGVVPAGYAWDPHSGQYMVWLCGYGDGSTHVEYAAQTVTLPQAQRIALTFYLGVETWNSGSSPVDALSLTVTDAQGVEHAIASWSDTDWRPWYAQQSYDLTAFAGQQVTIKLEGTENAGSKGTSFFLDDFSLQGLDAADTFAPAVALGPVWPMGGGWFFFTAEARDPGLVSQVAFTVDGDAQGTFTQDHSFHTWWSGMSDGIHGVSAVATDAAGLTGASAPVQFRMDSTLADAVANGSFEDSTTSLAPWTFTADVTGAAGSMCNEEPDTSPAAGAQDALLNGCDQPNTATLSQDVTIPAGVKSAVLGFQLRVLGRWSDGQPHDTLTVELQRQDGTKLGTVATFSNLDDTGGAYRPHAYDVFPLLGANGTVKVVFRGVQTSTTLTRFRVDAVGLATSTLADTMPPTVTPAVYGSANAIVLGAEAKDDVLVRDVTLYVDGSKACTVPGDAGACLYDSTALANGSHTLRAVATDVSGNASHADLAFGVQNAGPDTVPPSVTATVSLDGANGPVTLSATVTDAHRIDVVEFYLDGERQAVVFAPPYTTTFLAPSQHGHHPVEVRAYDAYGNVGTATADLLIDRLPTVAAGPDQTVDEGAAVTLSGTASDPDGDALACQWTQTGGPTVTLQGASTATATFTAPQVGAGGAVLTFSLSCTDDVGLAPPPAAVQVTVRDTGAGGSGGSKSSGGCAAGGDPLSAPLAPVLLLAALAIGRRRRALR